MKTGFIIGGSIVLLVIGGTLFWFLRDLKGVGKEIDKEREWGAEK